jgi:hypothetical protein
MGEPAADPYCLVGILWVDLHRPSVLHGFEGSKRLLPCARFGCDLGHNGLKTQELGSLACGHRDVIALFLVGVLLVWVVAHSDDYMGP